MTSLVRLPRALALLALFTFPAASQSVLSEIDLDVKWIGVGSGPLGHTFGTPSSKGRELVELAGSWYFSAENPATNLGRELYRTDGTAAGTVLVSDVNSGPSDSNPRILGEFAGKVYFAASTNLREDLWVTDGTALGTTVFFSLPFGFPEPTMKEMCVVGTKFFFTVWDSNGGLDLYVSDGSAGGTLLLRHFGFGTPGAYHVGHPGGYPPSEDYPRFLTPNPNGTGILFNADDGVHGRELWTSDGTPTGTYLVKDLGAGILSGGFSNPVSFGGQIAFVGGTTAAGEEIFTTDGTAAGTQLLVDVNPGGGSSYPYFTGDSVYGGQLYFTAVGPGLQNGAFVTDGTATGTQQLFGGLETWFELIGPVPGGLLVSLTLDSVNVGQELYLLSGGAATLVKDLAPGISNWSPSLLAKSSGPRSPLVFGGRVIFVAQYSSSEELWASDGTASGTELLGKIAPWGDVHMTPISASQFLVSLTTTSAGAEIFISDGTAAGTHLAADINQDTIPHEADPSRLTSVNGDTLYALANAAEYGQNTLIHCTANTGSEALGVSGAHLKPEPNPNEPFVFPAWLIDRDDEFFLAPSWPGTGLFHTSGTQASTAQIGYFDGPAAILGATGERLLFAAETAAYGSELWVSDGSIAGTHLLKDISPGPTGSDPGNGVVLNGTLYFSADDGVHGSELWKSDGTALGTQLLADINQVSLPFTLNTLGSNIEHATRLNDKLVFSATDGVNGLELWVSDGTVAGTKLLADINPGSGHTSVHSLTTGGGTVYVICKSAGAGPFTQLWVTDGTSAGTMKVGDVSVLEGPEKKVAWAGSRLFFEGSDAAFGDELWVYDGTMPLTVIDSVPGPGSAGLDNLTACGSRVYFSRDLPATGNELYVSDGTLAGTHLAADVWPGPTGSDPHELVLVDGNLFFIASNTSGEDSVYRYTLPGSHAIDLGFGGSGATLYTTAPVVGGGLTATVVDAPAGDVGVLVMSAAVAANASFVLPGNASWIDAGKFQLLGSSLAPTWSHTTAIPATPAFVGAQFNLQAWFLPPGLFPAKTSNGVRLVLGN